MTPPVITITIAGPAGVGKSALRVLIARALGEGLIPVSSSPVHPEAAERSIRALDISNAVVRIEEVQE